MNAFAELITDEIETDTRSPQQKSPTAGELGAEAASRYLRSHQPTRASRLLPDITGNALAAAFVFGLVLGRFAHR
jgi:hypothetical protein